MEIKERLFHARNITIWVSPQATNHDVQVSHRLACGLKQLGKNVQTISQKTPPSTNVCTVVLKGLAPRVDQVTYEKDQEDLKLHFTLQKGNLSPESVSLEVKQPADLTIIVGDNNAQYNYEKIYTFVLESLLNSDDPSLRLLGTVLFKLEHSALHDIYTATITQEDFRAALIEPKHISQVVEFLRFEFGDQLSYLFSFEKSSDAFQILLWSLHPTLKERLCSNPSSQSKGNWVLWNSSLEQKNLTHQQLLSN